MKRRSWLVLGVAIVALLAAPLTVLGGGTTEATVILPPSTAHGANFLFKSLIDTNFCIEAAAGNTEARPLTIEGCSTIDGQRWVLSDEANGDNQMLDSQGMCVDVRGRHPGDGLPVRAYLCRPDAAQTLSYTVDGQLESAKTGACLSIPGAASGAAVSLAVCDVTKKGQLFKLAH